MKKVIIAIIIIIMNLFADNTLLIKKEKKNNTLYKTLITVKNNLIENVNILMPNYLKIDPKTSFITSSLSYDTLEKKTDFSISLHLKLPGIKLSKIKTIFLKNKPSTTYIKSITIRPYIRLKSAQIKTYLKASLILEKKSSSIYAFNQHIYFYPFDNFWEEESVFIFKHTPYTLNLSVLTNKDIDYYDYHIGIHKLLNFNKKLFVIGFESSGKSNEKPVFISHILSFTYRQQIRSKRVYLEIKPYILYSKNYDYKLKEALYLDLTYKF